MPIYEYQCNECNSKYEVLVRTSSDDDEKVSCPKCNSTKNKKLFSTFSASVSSSGDYGCSDGSCGIPSGGGCSSGMCGLN
jgi:putative FmdB family regulatory protein